MTIARDNIIQPVVIYFDECEKLFSGGKKNKEKDGYSRFKKDLMLYKKQALTNKHNCIIICTTNLPEECEIKDIKLFFDKFIYFPYPDYPTRILLWKHYLVTTVAQYLTPDGERHTNNTTSTNNGNSIINKKAHIISSEEINKQNIINNILYNIDISSLANISEGYTAGSIVRTIHSVLTPRRIKNIHINSIYTINLIDTLVLQNVSYQDDKIVYIRFIQLITGIDDRRKLKDKAVPGNTDNKKGSKKSDDKKNKK